MRTKAAIAKELAALKKLVVTVPRSEVFGDANEGPLLAQIEVIEYDLSMDQITEHYEDGSDSVMIAALDAYDWLRDDGESLSNGWRSLFKKFPLVLRERPALHLV